MPTANNTHSPIPQRNLRPKDVVFFIFVLALIWLAYQYLPTLWSRTTQKAREMRGEVVTFKRTTPSFNEMLHQGGAFPSLLGSADAGLRSKGHGGVPGSILWQKETPLPYAMSPTVGPNERVLIPCYANIEGNKGQSFVAYNAQGTLLWQMPLENIGASQCWLENGCSLLVGTTQPIYNVTEYASTSLVMVNPDGKEMWRWNRSSLGSGLINDLQTTSEGQVLLNDRMEHLFSWKSNGETLWQNPLPVKSSIVNLASDAQGHIFSACRGGNGDALYCLNKEGKTLWKQEQVKIASRGVVGDDGNLRVVTKDRQGTRIQYSLLCLNPSGEELWHSQPLDIDGDSTQNIVVIALSNAGKTILLGIREILCLDKKGNVLWKEPLPNSLNNLLNLWYGMVVSSDGYIYVDTSRGIYTLAPNGHTLDIISIPGYHITGMALGDKRLYLTAFDTSSSPVKGHLIAYELKPPTN